MATTTARLRAYRRFILWSTKMELGAALHHAARQRTRLADETTQTTSARDRSPVAATNAATHTETYAAPAAPVAHSTLAHMTKYVAPVLSDFLQRPVPQFQYIDKIVDVPVVQVCRFSRCRSSSKPLRLWHSFLVKAPKLPRVWVTQWSGNSQMNSGLSSDSATTSSCRSSLAVQELDSG